LQTVFPALDAMRPRFAGGGCAAVVASLALGINTVLPRGANGEVLLKHN